MKIKAQTNDGINCEWTSGPLKFRNLKQDIVDFRIYSTTTYIVDNQTIGKVNTLGLLRWRIIWKEKIMKITYFSSFLDCLVNFLLIKLTYIHIDLLLILKWRLSWYNDLLNHSFKIVCNIIMNEFNNLSCIAVDVLIKNKTRT